MKRKIGQERSIEAAMFDAGLARRRIGRQGNGGVGAAKSREMVDKS